MVPRPVTGVSHRSLRRQRDHELAASTVRDGLHRRGVHWPHPREVQATGRLRVIRVSTPGAHRPPCLHCERRHLHHLHRHLRRRAARRRQGYRRTRRVRLRRPDVVLRTWPDARRWAPTGSATRRCCVRSRPVHTPPAPSPAARDGWCSPTRPPRCSPTSPPRRHRGSTPRQTRWQGPAPRPPEGPRGDRPEVSPPMLPAHAHRVRHDRWTGRPVQPSPQGPRPHRRRRPGVRGARCAAPTRRGRHPRRRR
jgi:hypothetical protein